MAVATMAMTSMHMALGTAVPNEMHMRSGQPSGATHRVTVCMHVATQLTEQQWKDEEQRCNFSKHHARFQRGPTT